MNGSVAPASRREAFMQAHKGVFLLDPADAAAMRRYLSGRGLLARDETVCENSKAGSGNMNCTLRVVTTHQRLIVKQARPWVERYDQIDAPWDRSLVEAAFYRAVGTSPELATTMPRLLDADADARILVLEDLGRQGDFTSLYAGDRLAPSDCSALVEYLRRLHQCAVPVGQRELFANRAMRALNHEHIFRFPLREANGLALDAVTPGLQALADDLKRDCSYVAGVRAVGERYLLDGGSLVHGDYFPGSWLYRPPGIAVIDPEFCFLGAAEFDFGVMLAHLLLAGQDETLVDRVLHSALGYDHRLIRQFAGAEIMRRLVGVAQLPLKMSVDGARALLERSRQLVMEG